jgi:hypothetical protein
MSAAHHDAGSADLILSHLQARDVAALRCRGSCFIEVEHAAAVDVAVTAFHLIFIVSHQGSHASRLAWGDVATMHLSTSPQGRRCAIIEFFVRDEKPAVSVPAPSSPKFTKVAQLIHAGTNAKAGNQTVRALSQIFAEKSVVHKIQDDCSVGKPLMFYIEDTQCNQNEHSIVIASQRAFLYYHFHKQMQNLLPTKSFVVDDLELLKQYIALENEVTAAASNDELLPLLEDLEDGARHHSIKHFFFHRPLVLNRLTKQLCIVRQCHATPQRDGSMIPSLPSKGTNIRFATAVLRCFSSIASDAYSMFNVHDAVASPAALHCLLAAVEPLTTEAELSDVNLRVALSGLLQAQIEAVFHCLFLCFCTPIPAPLASFLTAHLRPEQMSTFTASAVYAFICHFSFYLSCISCNLSFRYSLLRTASFLLDAKDPSAHDSPGPSAPILDMISTPKSPQASSLSLTSAQTNVHTSVVVTPSTSTLKCANLSVDVSAPGNLPPSSHPLSTIADEVNLHQVQSLNVM